MENTKDSTDTETDFGNNVDSMNAENSQDTISTEIESEIKVGNVKDIQQSDMVSISKDYNKIKAAEASVNSNFLFLRAGANALLPKKGPKRKLQPKKVFPKPSDEEKTDEENSGEKAPDSPRSDEIRSKSKVVERSPYYCHVCEVELNSEATYLTHIEGKKHQKKLDTLDIKFPRRARKTEKLQYMKIKEGCRIPRIHKPDEDPHMKAEFENLKEPCLGLQFISEIWPLDDRSEDIYYCSLCAVTCSPNAIISHIVGFKHRLAYMKLYDSTDYEEVKNLQTKKSELTAVLHHHAMKLEKRDGPGKVKVEIEVDDEYYDDDYGGSMGIPLNPENLSCIPSPLKLNLFGETLVTIDIPPFLSRDLVESINYSLQSLKAAVARYSPLDNLLKKKILHLLQQNSIVEKGEDMPWRTSKSQYSNLPGSMDKMRGPSDFMYDSARGSNEIHPRGFSSMNPGTSGSMSIGSQASMNPGNQGSMNPSSGYSSMNPGGGYASMNPGTYGPVNPGGYGGMNPRGFGNLSHGGMSSRGPTDSFQMSRDMRQNASFADDSMDIPPFPYGNNNQAAGGQEMWAPMAASHAGFNQYQGRGGQKRPYSNRDFQPTWTVTTSDETK